MGVPSASAKRSTPRRMNATCSGVSQEAHGAIMKPLSRSGAMTSRPIFTSLPITSSAPTPSSLRFQPTQLVPQGVWSNPAFSSSQNSDRRLWSDVLFVAGSKPPCDSS